MTPKEKAKELIDKMTMEIGTFNAKQCAIIAVDEIRGTVKMCIPYLNQETYIDYWDKVKAEIEQL